MRKGQFYKIECERQGFWGITGFTIIRKNNYRRNYVLNYTIMSQFESCGSFGVLDKSFFATLKRQNPNAYLVMLVQETLSPWPGRLIRLEITNDKTLTPNGAPLGRVAVISGDSHGHGQGLYVIIDPEREGELFLRNMRDEKNKLWIKEKELRPTLAKFFELKPINAIKVNPH
jgi:hypothetical protein